MGLLAATFAIFFSEISDDSSLSTSTAFLYTNFSSSFSFFSFLFCVRSSHQSSLEQDVLIKKYFGKVLRASANRIKTRKNNKECTREKNKNQKIHTTLTFAIPLETSMSNDIVSLKYYKQIQHIFGDPPQALQSVHEYWMHFYCPIVCFGPSAVLLKLVLLFLRCNMTYFYFIFDHLIDEEMLVQQEKKEQQNSRIFL